MPFVPILSLHKFCSWYKQLFPTNNLYHRNYHNNRSSSYSINYADYVSHDLSVKDKDTVIMKNDLDDIQYNIDIICGYFTIKIKSSYDNDSYSYYSHLYKTNKINESLINSHTSVKEKNDTKILKVHNPYHIGCSHYEIESENVLFGISVKEMMTYYYYKNRDSLDKNVIAIIKKVMNCSESSNDKNIFGFYVGGHFIMCDKFNTSINAFSKKMVYFEYNYFLFDDKLQWFTNLLIIINKCVMQLLYFRINESFKDEISKNTFNFDSPKMLIDCLKFELEEIKLSNTTEENIYYVNICNRLISKNKKNSRRIKTKIYDAEEDLMDDSEDNSIIPFVLENVFTLDSKLRLLESINIFTCFSIAFKSWSIGDSKIFLDFYDDLMMSHNYWFEFVKKKSKQYNKKFALPIHNSHFCERGHGYKYRYDDKVHNRNSKKKKIYLDALCKGEI